MLQTRALAARLLALLACFPLLFTSIPAALPVVVAQKPQPVAPADATQLGSISGTVTLNGAGLSGVTVTAELVTPAGKPQIILLPGVMGTALRNNAQANTGCNPTGRIWVSAWNIQNVAHLGPLLLNPTGTGPAFGACDIQVDGPIKVGLWGLLSDPYSAFLNRADDAYDILPYLGYDWRYDLEAQAVELSGWINANADLSRPIYLVAHSMGGLVARAFVADEARAAKIAGVVTVATPYLGAPMFFERAAGGNTGTHLDPVIDNDELRALIRYSPGVLQLVPSLRWFFREDGAGPAYVSLNGEALNYAQTEQLLLDTELAGASVLPKAEAFHDTFDGFDRPFFADGKYTVLYSTVDNQTPFQYKVQCSAEQKKCWNSYTVKGPGDGTVPVESASLSRLSSSAREGVVFCRYDSQVPAHGDLLTHTWVIDDILAALNGIEAGESTHCSTTSAVGAEASIPQGSAVDHRDIIIHGDVRVRVFDAGGNMTGPNDDGLIVWNIPDVNYQLIAGGVAVSMPLNANHRIEILQQGTEEVRVLASDFGSSAEPELLVAQTRSTFDNVEADTGAVLSMPGAGAAIGSLTLQVDTNADGTPEATLTPDAVLTTPEQAQDFTPPTSAIALSGTKDAQERYTGPVAVSVTATDTGGAGVLASYVSLNAGATWQQYTAPVSVQPSAATSVQVYTTDKAGNQEYPPKQQAIDFGQATHKIYLPSVGKAAAPRAADDASDAPALEAAPSSAEAPLIGPLPVSFSGAEPEVEVVTEPVAPAVVAALAYTTTTNTQGAYTFSNLPFGTYTVKAYRAGYSMLPFEHTAIVPTLPLPALDFTATLFTPDEDVLIPAGSFTMGCDAAVDPWQCSWLYPPETPFHTVTLSAYRIDKYEVTNARYAACVAASNCTAPGSTQAYNYNTKQFYEYYGEGAYNHHPVVNVTWHQAEALCRATGGRLPTEAEWERAARGKNDRRVWPWGNMLACSNANVWVDPQDNQCEVGALTPVGNYHTGASPEGVMDMAGNAGEWVSDWGFRFYTEDPVTNPLGPESGLSRVQRGGSFGPFHSDSRVAGRGGIEPDYGDYVIGFRCVRSP